MRAVGTVRMATRMRLQAKLQGRITHWHYTVMPTCIRDVSCAPMSAWLLQDAGPWVALQSMDGSGELRY